MKTEPRLNPIKKLKYYKSIPGNVSFDTESWKIRGLEWFQLRWLPGYCLKLINVCVGCKLIHVECSEAHLAKTRFEMPICHATPYIND